MTSNKLLFGIGTMFVLMTTIFFKRSFKNCNCTTTKEEMSMIPMDNTTTTTTT
jgi:hypothetical protein